MLLYSWKNEEPPSLPSSALIRFPRPSLPPSIPDFPSTPPSVLHLPCPSRRFGSSYKPRSSYAIIIWLRYNMHSSRAQCVSTAALKKLNWRISSGAIFTRPMYRTVETMGMFQKLVCGRRRSLPILAKPHLFCPVKCSVFILLSTAPQVPWYSFLFCFLSLLSFSVLLGSWSIFNI